MSSSGISSIQASLSRTISKGVKSCQAGSKKDDETRNLRIVSWNYCILANHFNSFSPKQFRLPGHRTENALFCCFVSTLLTTWEPHFWPGLTPFSVPVTGLLGLQCATHHLYLQTIRSSKADCNCFTASQVDTLRRAANFERVFLPNHLIWWIP